MHARSWPLLLLVLPLLTACGGGGEQDCPQGQVLADGVCVEEADCTPGETRCDGVREAQVCNATGNAWVTDDACGLEEICRDGMCLGTFACEDEDPACCATMAQCGELLQPVDCPECLSISRTGWCDAGACRDPVGETVSPHLVADGREVGSLANESVRSAVATVYHAYTADGGALDCERLLEGGTESRHDTQDPFLNPVYSQPMVIQSLGGNDQFEMRPGAVPVGTSMLVVITLYDGLSGNGTPLARGCVDGIDTTSQLQIAIPLAAF